MNRSFRLRRLNSILVVAGAVAAGCTPFGGWLYDDPTFVLSELTLRGEAGRDTLEMVLTACNRNDFPVQASYFTVSLDMGGSRIGSTETEQVIMLQTRDSTKVTVPLAMRPMTSSSAKPVAFVLRGRTRLQTPIGERQVMLFQDGEVQLKPVNEVAHIGEAGRPCRPGRATLPTYMPPVVVAPPPPVVLPTDRPQ